MDFHKKIIGILILNFVLFTSGIFAQDEINFSIRKPVPFFKGIDNKLDKDCYGIINLDCFYSHYFYRGLSTGIGFDYGNYKLVFDESPEYYNSFFYTPYFLLRYKLIILDKVFISPKFNVGYSILRVKFNEDAESAKDNGINLTSQVDFGFLIWNKLSFSLSGTFSLVYSGLIPLVQLGIYEYDITIKYISFGVSIGYLIVN
jgi:hypothetical protein